MNINGAFNQLAGNTAQADTRFTGHNTVAAPSRIVRPGVVANDETLNTAAGVTDVFTLTLIDKAVELAKTGTPPIRPIMVDGEKWFVVFIHPFQTTSLRAFPVSATAQVTWYDLQKSMLQGSGSPKNPIFTGALGTYNGCIIHESFRVPQGVSGATGLPVTTARRAILCGAQAGVAAFGQGHSESSYDWFEQMFDYGNKLGVKAGCISGLKKSVYNSVDFGTVVMSSKAIAGNVS